MKDIMLKITGRSFAPEQDDTIEFVTSGKLSSRGDLTFISYDETELSGLRGCRTSLTINDKKVRLKRSGEALPAETVMEFEQGKRFEGLYETPFGTISMEILTNEIRRNGCGSVSIDYNMSLRGLMESRKLLDIEVLGQEAGENEQ